MWSEWRPCPCSGGWTVVQLRSPVFEFEDFRLEPATRRLLKSGCALTLAPKDFDLLLVLVRLRERVVGKDELLRIVWPDVVVEESNLSQHIFTLRKLLGDEAEAARFIETLPRHGYRFVAGVRELGEAGGEGAHESEPRTVATGAGPEPSPGRPPQSAPRHRLRLWAGAMAVVLAGAALLGAFLARRGRENPTLRMQPLTDRRGRVYSARFDPSGSSLYYSAAWDGGPMRVYVTRPGTGASAEVPVEGSVQLLSVSVRGELALLLDPPLASVFWGAVELTLALAPATGGRPRPLLERVRGADFGPDGELAVLRSVRDAAGDWRRLEYPLGRVLVKAPVESYFCLSAPRVSPDGERVAYIDCDPASGAVEVRSVDRSGRQQLHYRGLPLGPDFERFWGLAWSPAGDEIWFARQQKGQLAELMAAHRQGRLRRLGTLGGPLFDVSAKGEALAAVYSQRGCVVVGRSDVPSERELFCAENPLGMLGRSGASLSSDGRFVVHGRAVGSEQPRVFLQPTDGSRAVPLGTGLWGTLSPDGAWALLLTDDRGDVRLVPTGAGMARSLPTAPLRVYHALFFADGRRVLLGAAEPGKAGRLWVLDLTGGKARCITPEQVGMGVPSPDGRWVATMGVDGAALYAVDTGERRSLGDFGSLHWPIVWSDDGCCVYWYPGELRGTSLTIIKLDLRTGERSAWREIAPRDPAGLVELGPFLAADTRTYGYGTSQVLTTLHLVSGLR